MKLLYFFIIFLIFISGCTDNPYEETYVAHVIDGDTFIDSEGNRIRLIGIDSPEKGQPYYMESKQILKNLIENREVSLEKDIENKDSYDRLLRYVYIEDMFVNYVMLEKGYARLNIIPPNNKYVTSLKSASNIAISEGKGIWTSNNSFDCIEISDFKIDAEGNDCYNLNGEYIVIENVCEKSFDFSYWTISDKSSNTYTFEEFILEPFSKVTIYSGRGMDSSDTLYWNNSREGCNAIWNNNFDTLFLRNKEGKLVLVKELP